MPAETGGYDAGLSAVLVRGRLLLPEGDMTSGDLYLNLESDEKTYRLRFHPKVTSFYIIEPGTYRLAPTRDVFGTPQSSLAFAISDRTLRIPIPESILRHEPIVVKPSGVVAIGTLAVKFTPTVDRTKAQAAVELDDRLETRRQLIQDAIRNLMDFKSYNYAQDSIISWTHALDQALLDLRGTSRSPGSNYYKPAAPR